MTRLCRLAAILIAVAGVIDPAVTLARVPRPAVAILGGAADPALADRVTAALRASAEIESGLSARTAAVVVVGDDLPAGLDGVTVPGFVVADPRPTLDVDEVGVPRQAQLETRVPVTADVHVQGGSGQTLAVTLRSGGVALDRADREVTGDDAQFHVPLTFVAAVVGPARLHLEASLTPRGGSAASRSAAADAETVIDRRPWSVFVFDRRPSWMSTFVRRALEADDRFAVTSRTVTSRAAATDTPNAPAGLTDPASLAPFDVIVLGAPDALTTADLAGVDRFLRRRGGAVLALWDVRPTGAPASLGGVTHWQADTRNDDRPVTLPDGTLRTSDIAWPAVLPPRADVLGHVQESAATGANPGGAPVVWSAPVGSGRLIVSGALDSWRYRAETQASFDAAWRQVVAAAAAEAMPPLTITPSPAVVEPGQAVTAHLHLADADPTRATTVGVELGRPGGASDRAAVRVWPDAGPGDFIAWLRAPSRPGTYALTATADATTATADLVVEPGVSQPRAHERDVLSAWATAHGGRLVESSALDSLVASVRALSSPRATTEPAHPMRSPWWIVPMTLLLGIDWLARRRRGLR